MINQNAGMGDKKYHSALPNGYQLHWYQILKVLGRGGFGITYLAKDTNLNRLVAIKEYFPSDLSYREQTDSVHTIDDDDEEQYKWGLERFITEAQTLTMFVHPNVVKVIAVFEANNTGYMVMHYEEGEELNTILKKRKTLPETELLRIILPLLDGLEKVHDAGFIHRDIKPHNILILKDGSPLLIDFGSARQAIGGKTRTLTTLVTPGYAPYEQYSDKSDKQGPWTDIYALSATMYRCVLGRPPIDAINRSEAIVDGKKDSIVSVMELGNKEYSKQILKAIDLGLRFRAEKRPQSIAAWKQEFSKIKLSKKYYFQEDADTFADHQHRQRLSGEKTNKGPTIIPVKPVQRRTTVVLLSVILVSLCIALVWNNRGRLPDIVSMENLIKSLGQSPPTQPVEDAEQSKGETETDDLLTKAEQSLKDKNYISPAYNNALYYFNEVLKAEPDNVAAKDGLKLLVSQMSGDIRNYIERGEIEAAREEIFKADVFFSDMKFMELLKIEVVAKEKQMEEVASEEDRQTQLLEEQKLTEEQVKMEQQQKEERIANLLKAASQDIGALRLTSPPGNNALEKYKEVLAGDPDNIAASHGILSIVDKYIDLAKREGERDQFSRAYSYLDQASIVTPDAENIKIVREDLQLKEKEIEEARLAEQRNLVEERARQEELERQRAEEGRLAEIEKQKIDNIKREENVITNIDKAIKLNKIKEENIFSNILLKMKPIEKRYSELGLDRELLLKEISTLLTNEGIYVTISDGSTINREEMVLELTFSPTIYGGNNFGSYKNSISIKYLNNIIYTNYDGLVSAQISDLKPTIKSYIRMVKEFISKYKKNIASNPLPSTENKTISILLKGMDIPRFQNIGLNNEELIREVKEILQRENVQVSGSKGYGVLELTFNPDYSNTIIWSWKISVVCRERGYKAWEAYTTSTDNGHASGSHIFELKTAKNAFLKLVEQFVADEFSSVYKVN